ncbi:GIY-YIG nuclease family protein [Candidatus Nitrotoga sp. AM1P]|uniref:GIY-YIG nuclease family protein n=1 Tax=Candidatus Nitrotoga sp. AM1P TaxID=2559597 RepID=UPI0010B69FBF|nr:GIY-YIG nuclease family protein [Candidatus Nitrotoga sp. AM1P]BBJ23198.1 hypothetical protein W01_11250 [Candidatus Nitrotoga sp. AM1P]
MNSHIYILTDGVNTKIGITTDLAKRMASYNTHNATIQLVEKYPCAEDEAKRVETAIKSIFKGQLTGKGKEWFSVSPDVVDRYVSNLLEKPLSELLLPSFHGAQLTAVADDLKEDILKQIQARNIKSVQLKQQFAELFATKFSLGIVEHKLPENVVVKDNLSIDIHHCISPSESRIVKEAVTNNHIRMPCEDHVWRFFNLVKLASGYYIAVCTAKVSMPYIERLQKEDAETEVAEFAYALGLYATFHHEWSWHFPNKTGLILYQPKTPFHLTLKRWDQSFRKWIIERREVLKNEPFQDRDMLAKTIEDIAHDNSFPLDIQSYPELCQKYFSPFLGFATYDEYPHWQKEAHIFLLEKWKASMGQENKGGKS